MSSALTEQILLPAAKSQRVVIPPEIVTRRELLDWCDYLRAHGLESEAERVEKCGQDPFWEKCPDGHYKRLGSYHCNLREYCPACAYRYARARAHETLDFLWANLTNCRYFMHIVLTLPHESELSDCDVRRAVKKLFARDFQTTYLCRIQYTGSRNPFQPHRHVHVFLPCVGVARNIFGGVTLKQLRPYFNLSVLRLRWANLIRSSRPVDLHVQYAFVADRALLHWLTYLYRYPVWDLFKRQIREKAKCECASCLGGYRGEAPFILNAMTVGFVLVWWSKASWVGFLANSCRYRVIGEAFRKDPVRLSVLREERERRSRVCPECGKALVREEIVHVGDPPSRSLSEIAELVKSAELPV